MYVTIYLGIIMTEKKKKLGKGLGSLLSSTRIREIDSLSPEVPPINENISEPIETNDFIKTLNVDLIQKNPYQPRRNFDEPKLAELAASIITNGLIQPIIVRKIADNYQLIAGERRLKATQIAGIKDIPAIVRIAEEEQVLEWALIENIHRSDLNSIERARAYQSYLKNFSLTQQEIAHRLGEDRSTIANYIRLLELPSEIQQMVVDEKISMGHARALLSVTNKINQIKLAEETVRNHLSVREIENRSRNFSNEKEPEIKTIVKNPNILELEHKMAQMLGTKVTIKTVGRQGKRGSIIIEFFSLDDFDRITERLNV